MSAALKRFVCGSCAVLAALVTSLFVFEGSALAQGDGPPLVRLVDAGFSPNAGEVRLYEDAQIARQIFKLDQAAIVHEIQALVKTFSPHDHLLTYLTHVTVTVNGTDTTYSIAATDTIGADTLSAQSFMPLPAELVSHVYYRAFGSRKPFHLPAGTYAVIFATDDNDANTTNAPGPSIGVTPFPIGPAGVSAGSNLASNAWESTFQSVPGTLGIRVLGAPVTSQIVVSEGAINFGTVPTDQKGVLSFEIDTLVTNALVRTQLDPNYTDNTNAQTDGPFSLPTPISAALTSAQFVTVEFEPTTEGVFSGTILLLTKDPSLPSETITNWGQANVLRIPVQGRGVLPNSNIIGLSQDALSVSVRPEGGVGGSLTLLNKEDGNNFNFTVSTEIIGPVWFTTGIQSGEVPEGGSVNIPFAFDAAGLTAGTYTGKLVVRSLNPSGKLELPLSLTVANVTGVAGSVQYYDNSALGVAGVEVTRVEPTGGATVTSSSSGGYTFTQADLGVGQDVVLRFDKPFVFLGTEERAAITGTDAVTALQKAAFVTTVNADQGYAGDVNGDNHLDNADALGILRYLAEFTDNIGATGQWRFSPKEIGAKEGATAPNVRAFLKGDVDGSFGPAPPAKLALQGTSAALDASKAEWKDGQLVLPVRVAFDGLVESVLLTLEYDPALLSFESAQPTLAGGRDYMMVPNGLQEGKVHIALAGLPQAPINEPIFEIRFQAIGDVDFGAAAELMVSRFVINDLVMPVGLNSVLEIQQAPGEFVLAQNNPNPFNPDTQIKFALPEGAEVRLSIYNLLGQEVRVLVNEDLGAGFHTVVWDGRTESGALAASGVYVYRIQTSTGFSDSKRMLLLK